MTIGTLCLFHLIKDGKILDFCASFLEERKELQETFLLTYTANLSQQSDTDLQWQIDKLTLLAKVSLGITLELLRGSLPVSTTFCIPSSHILKR